MPDKEIQDSSKAKEGKAIRDRRPPRSGVIEIDVSRCLACRECEVVCSLAHLGECRPEWSHIQVFFDDFYGGLPEIRVCKQCDFAACYEACADRWDEPAIVIDPESGARYVDAERCRGCGACVRACPLTPERQVIHVRRVGRRRVAFKCDLCRDREEGPLCVEICPGGALTFVRAEDRRG